MKRLLILSIAAFFVGLSLSAQSPKREIRAIWLSTVWRLDWPSVTVPASTGSNEAARESARNQQKTGLITVLNRLQNTNFNTVFFQVRGMSDAFYNSKYEPWSQYLSSERGADPGWDPLAFIIDEAHKRGIEVHAWLNPYRYSTAAESHGNLPTDYSNTNPNWLLDYGAYTKILNPGMPEVRQRICDVVEDILVKYDVDGIIFDDYFYVSGTTNAMDDTQYTAYNPKGLGRADWRRENVNQMVRDVQTRINSVKPYITFGISPAGVAASNASVAASYGVPPAPAGSDWQYSGIYSDPLAWLKDGSIDYISPQLYWTIGSGNDYSKLSPWWAKIANFFGRHYYSSNSSPFTPTELINQVNINRNADLNEATGSVYFRTNDLTIQSMNRMKDEVNQNIALCPVYGWKTAPTHGLVDGLSLSGQNLTWTYSNNLARYTIYAVPNGNRNDADAFSTPKYLVGVSYTKNFTLPSTVNSSTHKIAVAVYDRFGNEFSPRVLGESAATAQAAQLSYPTNGQEAVLPALFSWQPVSGAIYYVWELAEDASFSKPIVSRETANPTFNSGLITSLKDNTTYYWRVKTIKPNAPISISAIYSFKGTKFKIISPLDGADKVSLTPTFSWTAVGSGANYTIEISNKSDFSTLNFSATVQSITTTIPAGKLAPQTTYYARVIASFGTYKAVSERVSFVTEEGAIGIPVIISPQNGARIGGTEVELVWQAQDSKGFRAELSKDPTFPTRGTTLKNVEPFVYSAIFDKLTDGDYYLRVRAKNSEGLMEPSEMILVTIDQFSSSPQLSALNTSYIYYDQNGNCTVEISAVTPETTLIGIYSIDGVLLEQQALPLVTGKNSIQLNTAKYNKGIYLIRLDINKNNKTYKIIRK